MSAVLMLLASTTSSQTLMCNTIDADGVAAPYSIEIGDKSNLVVSVKPLNDVAATALPVSDISFNDGHFVSFTMVLKNKKLKMTFRNGNNFIHELSRIDGEDTSGNSSGLPYIVGVCADKSRFRPVSHRFTEPRHVTIADKKVQQCFSVTIDGRFFYSREQRLGESESSFSTWGLGAGADVAEEKMKIMAFPPIPKQEGFFSAWGSFRPEGTRGPSFTAKAKVNTDTLTGSIIYDVQTLSADESTLMVARSHCGFFPVTRG